MLYMTKGCAVNDPSALFPAYVQTDFGFRANVDADDIRPIIELFIALQTSRVFLILEIPVNLHETEDPDQVNVYYLDGLTKEAAIKLLRQHEELLIHDGLSRFGFGAHGGGNEIMREAYNIIDILTSDTDRYCGIWNKMGIPRVKELATAWNYIAPQTPGDCFLHTHNGKTIYDLVEELKKQGLYFAERR